jgi:hypothetical protein
MAETGPTAENGPGGTLRLTNTVSSQQCCHNSVVTPLSVVGATLGRMLTTIASPPNFDLCIWAGHPLRSLSEPLVKFCDVDIVP